MTTTTAVTNQATRQGNESCNACADLPATFGRNAVCGEFKYRKENF